MSKQIVGYINGQFTYGEVETIYQTDRVQIVRYGSASYALHVDGEYMSHHTTEAEARRYADMWVPPVAAQQPAKQVATADRTLFWFARTYGLDFADAERMAAYEAMTDAGHATRVSLLMNCDKLSFDAAVSIVAQTDAQFDREELAEIDVEPEGYTLTIGGEYCGTFTTMGALHQAADERRAVLEAHNAR